MGCHPDSLAAASDRGICFCFPQLEPSAVCLLSSGAGVRVSPGAPLALEKRCLRAVREPAQLYPGFTRRVALNRFCDGFESNLFRDMNRKRPENE